jgi:hypothetical protein
MRGFNSGDDVADYVIDYLKRPLLNYFTMRVGQNITTPIEGVFGPKVMIINEMAGSGGDWMPWAFHHERVGTLVGKRTWGGLVGMYGGADDYLDGGGASSPDLAFYTTDSKWEVENHGVPPDIDVEYEPLAVRQAIHNWKGRSKCWWSFSKRTRRRSLVVRRIQTISKEPRRNNTREPDPQVASLWPRDQHIVHHRCFAEDSQKYVPEKQRERKLGPNNFVPCWVFTSKS